MLRLLEKVLPRLISNPKIMLGYEISQEELEVIIERSEISFDMLSEVAWDNFFELCHKDLGITWEQGDKIRRYLIGPAKLIESERRQLIKRFPFITG